MLKTSKTIRGTNRDSSATDGSDHCETCGAPVGLTDSVLLKNNRFVGCAACVWGTAGPGLPPAQSTAAQRTATRLALGALVV